ncbi:MAG TPA: nuclear transport factor 2 family protein [Gemmatimonadales bacterium]|nr:nuclear transport factor 2 family protein [Gemmatimonadales bacterium]
MRSPLAACALAALLAPAALAAQQTADAEVVAVVRAFFDGMRSKDTAALRVLTHPSARLIGTGPTQEGQLRVDEVPMDRFLQIVAGAPGTLDEKIWDPEVRVDGDLATVWTQYAFYYDGKFSHCGVDAFQLARIAEGWKVVQIADTRRTAGCPTPPADAK